MSVDRCQCGVFVDTDYDADFYSEHPDDPGMCSGCRERRIAQQLEDERLDDPRHGQARHLNAGRF
jgi:hypothetical protein